MKDEVKDEVAVKLEFGEDCGLEFGEDCGLVPASAAGPRRSENIRAKVGSDGAPGPA